MKVTYQRFEENANLSVMDILVWRSLREPYLHLCHPLSSAPTSPDNNLRSKCLGRGKRRRAWSLGGRSLETRVRPGEMGARGGGEDEPPGPCLSHRRGFHHLYRVGARREREESGSLSPEGAPGERAASHPWTGTSGGAAHLMCRRLDTVLPTSSGGVTHSLCVLCFQMVLVTQRHSCSSRPAAGPGRWRPLPTPSWLAWPWLLWACLNGSSGPRGSQSFAVPGTYHAPNRIHLPLVNTAAPAVPGP